jgi:hypothetical protein
MLVVTQRLWELPDGTLGPIITTAAEDTAAGMIVGKFICPLPYITDHIHQANRLAPEGCASTSSGPRMVRPLSGIGIALRSKSGPHG